MKQRGIVLVSTLVVLTLTLMALGAGFSLTRASGAMAGSLRDEERALEAAQAGVHYARNRLQADPSWRGGTGDSVVVNMPGVLWVRENQGNVIGLLGSGSEQSMFRIRFNYQDGGGPGGDGLSNPEPAMMIPNIYVSENNLGSSQQKRVYRAQASSPWSVDSATSFSPNDCVRYSATVLSEGLAGDGLRDVSPSSLSPAAGSGHVAHRVAQALIGRNTSKLGDSPIYAANNLSMDLASGGRVKVRSSDHGVPPRARSQGNIEVGLTSGAGASLDMTAQGEADVNVTSGTLKVNNINSTTPVATRVDSGPSFPRIRWSEIQKAPASAPTLPAGTYVWRDLPRKLDYYAQAYDPAVGPPAASVTPTQSYTGTTSPSTSLTVDPTTLTLRLTNSVNVQPVGAVNSVAIVPADGLVSALHQRPHLEFQTPAGGTAPILSAPGDVTVQGNLRGQGSVTSSGNITFQGTSVLEADMDSRTAIYAQGDISLLKLPNGLFPAPGPAGGGGSGSGGGGGGAGVPFFPPLSTLPFGAPTNRDIAFAGLFYSQKGIKADFGTSSTAPDLYFRGMVVAYGGNPDAGQDPGASSGPIEFHGGDVYLEYDSRYLMPSSTLTAPAKLELTSYNVL